MGNNSNPELALTGARVQGERAELGVLVSNPSSHELVLTGIDYELVYGPLPVGSGSWTGSESLPAGGSTSLKLGLDLDGPVLDPAAPEATISGVMQFGGGGGGETAIKAASFESSTATDH